jgi:hypothetical protein
MEVRTETKHSDGEFMKKTNKNKKLKGEQMEKFVKEIDRAFDLGAPSDEALTEFASWASEIETNFDDFENDEALMLGIV